MKPGKKRRTSTPVVMPDQTPRDVRFKAALLVVLTLVIYLPAMRAGFVVDDFSLLVKNPVIAAGNGLSKIWASTTQPDYFPLTLTSFWLEWRLWRANPLGYHVVNVLLHITGAGLLWYALRLLRLPGAWLAALVFAVHPVSVASVAWISERKNTLSFVFYALSFVCFLEAQEKPKPARARFALLSMAAFVLGLLSKTSGVTLPLVLLGLLWWRRGKLERADFVRTLPYFVASVALGLVTVWFQFHRAMNANSLPMGAIERVVRAAIALPLYATRLLVPVQLSFVYEPLSTRALVPWALLPVVVGGGLTMIVWRLPRARRRGAIFALGSFAALLLPVLGLVDMALLRHTPIADHWQYLASPALLTLVVAALFTWCKTRSPKFQRAAIGAGTVVVALLCVLSWRRAGTYTDDETLWRDTIAKAPRSAYAYANLGTAVFERSPRASSKEFFLESLRIEPKGPLAPLALYKLALIDLDERQDDAAIARLQTALSLDAGYVDARQLLATALIHAHRPTEARSHVKTLLVPHLEKLLRSGRSALNLGRVLARDGHAEGARATLQPFFSTPVEAGARTALGSALIEEGDLTGAESELASAVRLDPNMAEAYLALGFIADNRGDVVRAIDLYRKTLAIAPNNAEAGQRLQMLVGGDSGAGR